MMSNEHLVLRQHMYEAHGIYHQAMADYWAAVVTGPSAEQAQRELQTLRAAAAVLDTALVALLDNVRQQESSLQIEEEIQRIGLIQDLLARELALLPVIEAGGDGSATPDQPEGVSR
jgi:hypothetical protein